MPKPMLAESVKDANQAAKLVDDPHWTASQKVDGHRLVLDINEKRVRFLNRNGDKYQHPIHPDLKAFTKNSFWGANHWIFDGEYLPDQGVYWVFDTIKCPLFQDDAPYSKRREITEAIMQQVCKRTNAIRLLPVASDKDAKAALMVDVFNSGGEGVMFRHRDSTYHAGQRSRSLLKYKYVDTADVIVDELSPGGKRSVSVKLADGTELGAVAVSDRTLAALNPGDVIEVRYLYLGANGRLYQPAFIRRRNDKTADECTADQLKPVNKGVLA